MADKYVEGSRQECIESLERLAVDAAAQGLKMLVSEARAAVEFLQRGADSVYAGEVEYRVVEQRGDGSQ